MKTFARIVVLVAAVGLIGTAFAGEEAKTVTITGKVVCAMCVLQKDDAKDCQNILIVDKDGDSLEYYIVKNAAYEKYGHACRGERSAVITGKLIKKDGKTWIEPSKMDEPKG